MTEVEVVAFLPTGNDLIEPVSESVPSAKELFSCGCGSRYVKANKSAHEKSKKHKQYVEDNLSEVISSSDESASGTAPSDYDDVESTIDIKKIMYSIVQKSIEDMVHVYLTSFFENLP